jgi:predicted metal-dependent hydrolase
MTSETSTTPATSPERSQVQWGLTTIPYEIRRRERRATVSIAVEPSGEVVLTAPPTAAVEKLDRLILTRAPWIVAKLRRRSDLPPAPAREFVSGETFLYLGRQHRLRIEPDSPQIGPLTLEHGWLRLRLPRLLEEQHRPAYARAALLDWYTRKAQTRLPERLALWAKKLDVPLPRLLIREPRKRWGSCHPSGIVRLNWRIIQAPLRLVDYVVAHELCHLLHEGHGRAFWATLGRAMPDYEARRSRLVELGARLTW